MRSSKVWTMAMATGSIFNSLFNKDKRPNIYFYAPLPSHYDTFRNVHKLMLEVKIVVGQEGWDIQVDTQKLTSEYLDDLGVEYLTEPDGPVDFIISCTPDASTEIRNRMHKRTKRIRLMYSVIDKNWTNTENVNKVFDLVLTPGDRSTKKVSPFAKCISVGFPKYDEFFLGQIDGKKVAASLGLDAGKKTVTYAPTWHKQCTIDEFWQAIIGLSGEYNVVVKPHALTSLIQSEHYRLDFFKGTSVRLVGEECQLSRLFTITDAVITDYSSTIFEAAACNIPLVLLGKEMDAEDNLYSPDNLEQMARDIGINVNDPSDLADAVKSAMANQPEFVEKRRMYTQKLISNTDGTASIVAAKAIREFVNRR